MSSKVYFTKDISPKGLEKVYNALGIDITNGGKNKVGVKVSTGEDGAKGYLKPELIGPFVKSINGTIIECNTAYPGARNTAKDHVEVAKKHGFTTYADVDIMDAEGEFEIPTPKNSKHLNYDLIGENFKNYDAFVNLAHGKGHAMGGFGANLKNQSIGIASRNGKAYIHSCGKTKSPKLCWISRHKQIDFIESMAEAATAVSDYLKAEEKPIIYITVANALSLDCDCDSNQGDPVMEDIGIFASLDPVANDQAFIDAIWASKDKGAEDLKERIDSREGRAILPYAESLGLGSTDYELIELWYTGSMNRLVLIDGKSVFYRGYYAMGALGLPDGTPTGGVYGFAAIAMEIVKKLNPTKVVVAWDSKTSTAKRKVLFEGYKAGRVKPGEDFYAQIPLLKELVKNLGWTFVELDEYEADDIIGTLSKQADEEGNYETYIISSDLDMLQIVDSNTHMWRILKGFSNIEKIDVKEIEAKYGIKKSQFLDLKALKGDSSDNIPGVPGIGEKTAAKLLNDYHTLDGVYDNIEKIKGSTRTKLEAGKDSAYLSKKLAEIMFDAPIKLTTIPNFVFNKDRIISGLKKLQFNSLIRKIESSQDSLLAAAVTTRTSEPTLRRQASAKRCEERSLANNLIINDDIKSLMHNDKEVAEKILNGAKFWDLSQAAFLLDPLARELPPLIDPEQEYKAQLQKFQNLPRLYNIYTDFDLPLIPVLYQMEEKGMLLDRQYFAKLRVEYEEEVKKLEQKIYTLANKTFNINSPIQLSSVLFADLNLPIKGIKKTSRGYSTGAKELDKLKSAHPIIEEIIKYREATKL